MKILILQLARLGDIYQTWPVVRALKRTHGAHIQIDLLTRERFSAASIGLEELNRVYKLDSKKILAPIFSDHPKVQESADHLDQIVSEMRENCYDRIINLSYSTFSSYLTGAIATPSTKVAGYSRFDDGFLNIPDDVSSYFFAQVGVGLSNRIHITDLFAQAAEVELVAEDFHLSQAPKNKLHNICVHIGASSEHKRVSPMKWRALLTELSKKYTGRIVLIGSDEETSIADEIMQEHIPRVMNAVGKTKLLEVKTLISQCELLIGADSAPIHIASLTQTRVVNLSFETVNFWETGPKSIFSQIIRIKNESDLTEDYFVNTVMSTLRGDEMSSVNVLVNSSTEAYVVPKEETDAIGWQMALAIYTGADFPHVADGVMKHAMLRLFETNEMALEQIDFLKKDSQNKIALGTFEQCDQIFTAIEKFCPDVGVIVRWILAEKLRIAPGNYADVLVNFENVHRALDRVLRSYPIDNWYQLKNGVLNDKNILDEA